MRSENAKKFIESNTLDLEKDSRMDTTGYVSYAVSAAKAYGAIEIAEQEMIEKAIKGHILQCPKLAVGRLCCNGKYYEKMNKCDGDCDYVKWFKKYME